MCSNYDPMRQQIIPNWHVLILKSSRLCVPPIFKKYDRINLLPIWIWIIKFEGFFVKVRIANFKAISSETFMWCLCPFFCLFPLVEVPLQYAPHPFVEASVWMVIWGSCCWIFLPLDRSTKEVLAWQSS